MAALLKTLKDFFRPDADRTKYAEDFRRHLHGQARTLQVPGAALSLVAWLGFAFDTDRKLHPEFPELFYFRIGLSVASFIVLLAVLSDRLGLTKNLRGEGNGWVYFLYGYIIFTTSFFTGRIADDPNYVSGLQIVIILMVLLPVSLRFIFTANVLSLSLFVGAILLYRPALDSESARYSMQNLAIAYVVGFVMGFFLDRLRFTIFLNHTRVVEKSAEIQTRMEEIRVLKENQDGDYFLTANLITPLIKNEVRDGTVGIDFCLNQNKKFHFKKWNSEIGGDFLTAHTIRLRDRKYTAFVNGDAMGKSIQGAGGALVLGTVFRSVIERTRLTEEAAGKSPEKWLKDAFLELQNVFVTFDGSMLISAVLGLVDNQTGFVYFFNAEHPWVVLYRDGRADFIERETNLRKIGILETAGSLRIKTFQLTPGDVLIVGSDGRDDIVTGTDERGQRVLNEDETEFLRRVEEGTGELERIHAALLEHGQLADDLSMMRIAFQEDAAAPAGPGDDRTRERDRLRELIRRNGREKNYSAAAEACASYVQLDPADQDILRLAARYFKLRFIESRRPEYLQRAADFGERFRIREPGHTKHLVNLADVYRLLDRPDRARMILNLALEISPDDPQARKLETLLAARR